MKETQVQKFGLPMEAYATSLTSHTAQDEVVQLAIGPFDHFTTALIGIGSAEISS